MSAVDWSMEAQTAIRCHSMSWQKFPNFNGNQRGHGDAAVRRWFRGNRLPHHRPCDISSKQNYSNRLHSRDLIVLGLIEVLWLSEDRYKILTIFRTSSFNAGEYVDHKIQIWLGFFIWAGSNRSWLDTVETLTFLLKNKPKKMTKNLRYQPYVQDKY